MITKDKTLENKNKVNVHKNHRKRLREELRSIDFNVTSDYKLLEFLLFYGHAQKDVNPIAHNLINTFGSFSNVLEASYNELIKVDGIGEACASLITSILPMFDRYTSQKAQTKLKAKTTRDFVSVVGEKIKNESIEKTFAIILNNKFELYKFIQLNTGTNDNVEVKCTEIYDIMKGSPFNKIILMHNHPSGNPTPSSEDLFTTRLLYYKLSVLDIMLVDHIIVSSNGFFSFKDAKLIEEYENEILKDLNKMDFSKKHKK